MVGMIFAAGVGSRLKPWTDSHPKALVPVGGEPMLGRVIRKMVDTGIEKIVVNVHHFASQIVDYLAANDFGARILISDESDCLLDTGGGLANALPLIGDDDVLVHNADILETLDLRALISYHIENRNDATLLIDPRKTTRRLVFAPTGLLKGWTNLSDGAVRPDGLVISEGDALRSFDGVHIVSRSLFEPLREFASRNACFSIIDFYIRSSAAYRISGFEIPDDARWFDVGKPETLESAEIFIKNYQHNA